MKDVNGEGMQHRWRERISVNSGAINIQLTTQMSENIYIVAQFIIIVMIEAYKMNTCYRPVFPIDIRWPHC